jgi:CheY-like chemotaxis protein
VSDKPTALIVDDEGQIRKLLRVVLEDQGYHVIEADSGKAGLAEAATRRPDVILLDLGLPDMDGVVALKRLREWTCAGLGSIGARIGRAKIAAWTRPMITSPNRSTPPASWRECARFNDAFRALRNCIFKPGIWR